MGTDAILSKARGMSKAGRNASQSSLDKGMTQGLRGRHTGRAMKRDMDLLLDGLL